MAAWIVAVAGTGADVLVRVKTSRVLPVGARLRDGSYVSRPPRSSLYRERWEIETAFRELQSTTLGGRVRRARTPTGVDQEIYALLATYQALPIAIGDATLARPDLDPDRASFTVALHAAHATQPQSHHRHRHPRRRRPSTPSPTARLHGFAANPGGAGRHYGV